MAWLLSRALLEAFASSRYSQGQEAGFSGADSLGGELSVLLSGSHSQLEFLHDASAIEASSPSPFGTISKPLTADLGEALLTWCREDFHARTSAAPAEELESVVRVRDYGTKWRVLSEKWSRDMSAWKTPPSLLDEGWRMSLPTLPRWGSMSDGQLWERQMSVRRTSETASGFTLPTPVKYDAYGTWESNNYHGLGWLGKHGFKATDEELREAGMTAEPDQLSFWPTPLANDATGGSGGYRRADGVYAYESLARKITGRGIAARERKAGQWPTPMTQGLRGGSGAPKDLAERNGLPAAVRKRVMYPTPVVSDSGQAGTGEVTLHKVLKGKAYNQLSRMVAIDQRVTFPTPIANDSTSGSDAAGREGGASLKQTIRSAVWPTPMTQGLRGGSGAPKDLAERIGTPTAQNGLRGGAGSPHHPGMWQHPGHPEHGELNPEWVEWLMGWPLGWTSLDPLPENSMAVWFGSMHGPVGRAPWWSTDPSVVSDMRRTCHKDLPDREARIAALGNGQVSAAMAAAWLHLIERNEHPPEEDHDD